MRAVRVTIILAGLCLSAAATTLAHAQTPVYTGPPGPGKVTKSANRPHGVSSVVPGVLTDAHTVFLSNGGADAGLFPHPFTGTQDRAYGYVFKALGAGSRFTVAASPAEADLVLELSLKAPFGSDGGDKKRGTQDALPTFTLVVYDRPTHYVLWTLSQTVDKANLQKTHDKNFDDALDLMIKELMTVSSGNIPAAPPEPVVAPDTN